jgi:RNA polymerase sigma-70 factor (ECF subfamily)
MPAYPADDRSLLERPASTEGPAASAEAGDAFDQVYRDHVRFVWRCARRLGIHDAGVEDVVQDVFLVVHRRLGEFQGRSSTKTWLYGIVRRVVADHQRTRRRKPLHLVAHPESEIGERASPDDAPDRDAERSEQVALMRRVLARLAPDKREVLVLADFEEMTLSEIAEATETNANTMASRLRVARRQFEAALEQETRRLREAPRAHPQRSLR